MEPVFPGAWVPIPHAQERATSFTEHVQSFEGEPSDLVEAPFDTFGWERPSDVTRHIVTRFIEHAPAFQTEPADFVEPVFFSGWWREQTSLQQVAGIPPLIFHPHTIADEDFVVTPFSTFGWERPSEFQLWVNLRNVIWEDAAPDYEAIITTPDLVNFAEWNPHYLILPVPEAIYYTLVDWIYVAEPTVWDIVPPVVPPFIAPPAFQGTEEDELILRLINQSALKILDIVGCQNRYPFPFPPTTAAEGFVDLLTVSEGLVQNHYEGWFFHREGIGNPLEWGETQYTQKFLMRIEGVAWHENFPKSRLYIQQRTEQLLRTIEKNKDFGIGAGVEVRNLEARFRFQAEGEVSLYRTNIKFELLIPRKEPSGRNT